jgi:oligopeptide/dipeptide ABC transporter ATP-binding protein
MLAPVGNVYAVDGVSLTIGPGETVGLVGESGCGKTTVGRCIIRLYQPTAGRVIFDDTDLLSADAATLRRSRRQLQMIFQDPFESLNSRHTVGDILAEPFIIHRVGSAAERAQAVMDLLERVGLAADAAGRFPHEFSGGQRQRIGIARAIALNPKLVVCDEPVSALDVSIQSQIINLLLELQAALGLSYLFIAHDLAVVKHVSDSIAVMYLGRIVEYAAAGELYENPLHPYTQALIAAIPDPDPRARKASLPMLSGDVPSPIHPPAGCHFHTRCPFAKDRCRIESPLLKSFLPAGGCHRVACHFAGRLERLSE